MITVCREKNRIKVTFSYSPDLIKKKNDSRSSPAPGRKMLDMINDPRCSESYYEQGISAIKQELLGHASSKTTEIYTHVSRRELSNIGSPLDKMIKSDELTHSSNNRNKVR